MTPAPLIYATNGAQAAIEFFGLHSPRWNALESDPSASLIKNGRQRKVWRVSYPGGCSVYAKVFDDPVGSSRRWLKRVLRVHPAMREWDALLRLQKLGVPAVRPIAVAKYSPSCDLAPAQRSAAIAHRLVLLTEGIENSTPLISSWKAMDRTNARRSSNAHQLSAIVAGLWAQAHNLGYAHPDGHPGNVLIVSDDPGGRPVSRAVFMDPARSAWTLRRRSVSADQALFSLVMLDQYFHRSASRTDRLRFWRDYWLRRNILLDGRAERRMLGRLADCASVHRAALARQRDRRLRGDGKYFGHLQLSDGWRAKVLLQLERRHVYIESTIPDRSFEEWATLCTQMLRAHSAAALAAKGLRLLRRPVGHRGHWAEKLFRHCHRLRHRDIPAPLILGFLQNRGFFGIRDEYLILPAVEVPGCHDIAD